MQHHDCGRRTAATDRASREDRLRRDFPALRDARHV